MLEERTRSSFPFPAGRWTNSRGENNGNGITFNERGGSSRAEARDCI